MRDVRASIGRIEPSRVDSSAADRERELLIEAFSCCCEQIGEDETIASLKNNKKWKEHLVPLRKIVERELAMKMNSAEESAIIAEKHLSEFIETIPPEFRHQHAAFMSIVDIIKNATPASIGHVKMFAKAVSLLSTHAENFSPVINSKLRQTMALKRMLDELIVEAVDEVLPLVSTSSLGKRKDCPPSDELAIVFDLEAA